MTATVQTYDPSCSELAEYFLAGVPELNHPEYIHSLALEIQQVVEDQIQFMLAEQAKDQVKP